MTPSTPGQPLTAWTCDTCGDQINDPQNALVTWRVSDERPYYDFLVVHKNRRGDEEAARCDPGSRAGYTHSLELDRFLGADGLTMLLSWLSAGPVIGGAHPRIATRDLDEYVDLVRRMQVPHYERARPYFQDSHVLEELSDANEVFPYLPEVLQRIADRRL